MWLYDTTHVRPSSPVANVTPRANSLNVEAPSGGRVMAYRVAIVRREIGIPEFGTGRST